MRTYTFTVRHPERPGLAVVEEIDVEGEFNVERAKQALKAKFPESSGFSFQGVKASSQDHSRWDRPEYLGGGTY